MMDRRPSEAPPRTRSWRSTLHEIIFEADTPLGKAFDVALLVAILASIVTVMLESVDTVDQRYHRLLAILEWTFTIVFSIEYILRLICVRRPILYARSFFGIIDLLAILPTYLSLLIPGAQQLLVIRALRLLRLFRVFKLGRYLSEARALRRALWASRQKIIVFLATVLVIVVIVGSLIHLIEGPENGFTSIPRGVYWAIVTLTTVGYGDVSPNTVPGQMLAGVMMILGYSLIIIPTGIFSAELAGGLRAISTQSCPACSREGHEAGARFCNQCGTRL